MAELHFFTGTMDSGKSTLALQTNHNHAARGRVGRIFTTHDRSGQAVLSSRLGLTHEEAAQRHPADYARHHARDPRFAPAGGESLLDLAARLHETIDAIVRRHAGEAVALFTHGGVLDILHRQAKAARLPGHHAACLQIGPVAQLGNGFGEARLDLRRKTLQTIEEFRHGSGRHACRSSNIANRGRAFDQHGYVRKGNSVTLIFGAGTVNAKPDLHESSPSQIVLDLHQGHT